MIDRKDLGSWMDGAPTPEEYVPGASLGLPAEGPGAVAPTGRRFASLLLDWALALGLATWLLRGDELAVLFLFCSMNVLLITVFGATPAQFVLGLRVRPVGGRSPMLLRALVRTAALALVLPAVFWNGDKQPLHDVVAGTAVVRA